MRPICPILHQFADGILTEEETAAHIDDCADCRAVMIALRQMATRKAGSTKSVAKSEAARLNGMKGGRPRTKN